MSPTEITPAQAADFLPSAVLLIDGRGIITYVNDAAEALFERSARRLAGEALDGLGPWGSASRAVASRAVSEGRAVFAHDVRVEVPDGTRRGAIDAAPQGDGACISIRLWPEAGAVARGDRAANAAAGFGRLLSHELKNPMAGARGAAQLIASSADPETAEMAALIMAELDRALRIADRWSKVGDIAPHPFAPFSLNEVASEALRSMSAASGKGLALIEDYDPSLPDAFGDRDLVLQAVLNLLVNAAEAVSGQSDGAIEITTRYRMARPGGVAPEARLQIDITDNGPGVPDELGESIFSPFVTGKPAGEGLGLALVSRVAELHGGGLEYESRAGRTVFRMYLREEGT
ncbi:ATPase [Glycocaulis albus]|jgi:two-component system, NtrC family, nitrogen regulation sensor histidine kinase GlnL|uniref:histidine kinase n=1 Tax=Glycocaulis albus TaxID=1382801 RepID=A0ABQ1XGV0_9PROT|nr:ATP-binding protein [Glycocaulis albus]GGG93458.1 ATPase [Glycocaulis albus]